MVEGHATLPAPLLEHLQSPRLVQLVTLDPGGAPFVNTLSWVLGYSPETLRLVGDARTQFIRNLMADGRVALTVLGGGGTVWTIYGQAAALGELEPVGPLRPVLVAVNGLRVMESLFPGARLTQEPQWAVTGNPADAARFNAAVFRAMREYR
jgi:hypothetical protein